MQIDTPVGPLEIDGRPIIGGRRVETARKMSAVNPASGEVIGDISICGEMEVAQAIGAARKAQAEWAAMGVGARVKILRDARRAFLEGFDSLAATETLETGKPLAFAETGPAYALLTLDYYCRNAGRFLEDVELGPTLAESVMLMPRRTYKTFYPRGVVGIIVPWNYPIVLAMLSIVPALAAGNTVVYKPSSFSTFTGSRLAEILNKAGLPPGVLNMVSGPGEEAGDLITKGDTDMVIFTGSAAAGKQVASNCAQRLCPAVLELGGLDPMIVTGDADIEEAANGALYGSFANTGQTCIAAKRVFVHKSVAKRFISIVVRKTRRLRIGGGFGESDIGPLISAKQLERVERFVSDAISKGAKVETGGKRVGGPGFFYEPTVLTAVKSDMLVLCEEPFGPIMPVMEYGDEEEAAELANSTPYGLGGSVWSRDARKAGRLARRIEAGTVWINDVSLPFVHAPFGGVKKSGILREGAKEGMREMCNEKVISAPLFRLKSRPWWFPFDNHTSRMLREWALSAYGKGITERSKNMLMLTSNMLEHRKETGKKRG